MPVPGGLQAGGLQATGPACTWSATKSKRTTWNSIAATDPAILVVSCCGFDYARNVADARMTLARHPVACTLRAVREGRVFAVDGNRCVPPHPVCAQARMRAMPRAFVPTRTRPRSVHSVSGALQRGAAVLRVHRRPLCAC